MLDSGYKNDSVPDIQRMNAQVVDLHFQTPCQEVSVVMT
jgi:hypothetical protein